MDTSIFLAKLLGPYIIIVAGGVLLNLKTYQKVMGDFINNTALTYLGGILALIFGLLVVLVHNIWAAHWVVMITIFGWLGLIKGAWLIIFPNQVGKFAEVYLKKTGLLIANLIVGLVIGVALTILGYCGG